jgi:hypothetical protein
MRFFFDTATGSAAGKKGWADPKKKAQRIAAMLTWWDDPMHTALRRGGLRCGHSDIEDDARTARGDGCRLCTRERQRRWLRRMKRNETRGNAMKQDTK